LTDAEPALERRRIAHPKAQNYAFFKVALQQGFAPGEMGFNDKSALHEIPERSLSALGLGCSLISGARWLCRFFLGSRQYLLARAGLMRTGVAERIEHRDDLPTIS
jgi:hypothetical protein